MDSTGLKLGGAGEWLAEKHGTSRRRSWRKLHIRVDADSGEIVAVEVIKKAVDDGALVDALLDQIVDPIASLTTDGDYDQDPVRHAVAKRYPDAAMIVPPRAGAVACEIRAVHEGSHGRYGSPRVHAELRGRGRRLGRKRVARLMRQMGLSARRKRRFRRTTDSTHSFPVAPNLLERRFSAPAPDRIWLADITYIWTEEDWLYLAVMLDLFTRRVVGWPMVGHLGHELALAALDMAIARCRPAMGLVHHSDRGVQYAAHAYRRRLQQNGMLTSMSRMGDCWDNAPMESFFATLKGELIERRTYQTRANARADIFAYIEGWYNRRRLHSAIGYKTPEQMAAVPMAA